MSPFPSRLVLASDRAPQIPLVSSSLKKNIIFVNYKYDTSTLNDIIVKVHQSLFGARVSTIAFLVHSSETQIFLSFADSKVLSVETLEKDESIRSFFLHLIEIHTDHRFSGRRLDFLNCCVNVGDVAVVASRLQALLRIGVGISKDLFGSDIEAGRSNIGELYFEVSKLQEKLKEKDSSQDEKLKGYEKIRSVGKGAFGTAILYRKLSDESLVVIKEINMIELNAAERQMALNEVQVLSVLDHPNIISYYRSFEKDGILMIEMEYADGGTLAQLLSRQNRLMDEHQILIMFRQIVSAIKYMHHHNILHRDLKAANVFLTKNKEIKVGDFGISKVMSTRAQAQTVLGTPYYLSPEMCEGKQYDQKSDVWALGCILYEMACLQKTFEGSNLPALVNKIMKGHFRPVPAGYSSGFRQLIHDLLQKDPHFRPSASEIHDVRIPRILDSLSREEGDRYLDRESLLPLQNSTNRNSKPQRSVLYEMTNFESSTCLRPIELPPKCKIKEIAVSNTHYIALTSELMVYTWGEGSRGQLGHGDSVAWKRTPTAVEALRGKSIKMIGAGDAYSVFVSDSGMLMTCGDGTFGSLGHGDWNSATKPRLIEKLLSIDVSTVSCGNHHVAILSVDGVMHSWGRGQGGRLGLGHEEDVCSPTVVGIPNQMVLRNVRCGGDATMAVTSQGILLACGRNSYNKLGLSNKGKLFPINLGEETEKALTLKRVASIKGKVSDVSLGANHTTVLMESGRVITMGRNTEGQLGRNSTKTSSNPSVVKSVEDKVITMVQSGPTYTVIGTIENAIYFWGTKMADKKESGLMGSRSKLKESWSRYTGILTPSNLNLQEEEQRIIEPREILALYASPQQIGKGETVSLAALRALPRSILILVDTTVPLIKKCQSEKSSEIVVDDSDCSDDVDSLGPIPDWIKAEVAESEASWTGYNSTKTRTDSFG